MRNSKTKKTVKLKKIIILLPVIRIVEIVTTYFIKKSSLAKLSNIPATTNNTTVKKKDNV